MENFIDWNKLSLDDYCNYLEKLYMFQSTGEAKAIMELINFYRENKPKEK